jgi:hypothetical protein
MLADQHVKCPLLFGSILNKQRENADKLHEPEGRFLGDIFFHAPHCTFFSQFTPLPIRLHCLVLSLPFTLYVWVVEWLQNPPPPSDVYYKHWRTSDQHCRRCMRNWEMLRRLLAPMENEKEGDTNCTMNSCRHILRKAIKSPKCWWEDNIHTLKSEFLINNISKSGSYLTGNTSYLRYKAQRVKAIYTFVTRVY